MAKKLDNGCVRDGKIIKVNILKKIVNRKMNSVTLHTGRAQGVIQEVATDKIEQIAEEEQKLFRLHRSATRAL